MIEMTLNLPTYDYTLTDDDYRDDKNPIKLEVGNALRIILGTDKDSPDIFIERQAQKWVITLHPGDGDPIGSIRRLDNGKWHFSGDRPESPVYELTEQGAIERAKSDGQ